MTQENSLFDQITRTKVILPRRRSGLITRPRLAQMFEDLLDYRLFLVTAPAGFGKSSLLVDIAHQLELPVCWYAIDTLDTDPHRFIIHFIAAIAQRFPDFGQRSLAILENATLDTHILDRLVTSVVNEIYQHVQEHFVIVLDDWHLANNRQLTYFINRFSQLVDENCHLVISSRTLVTLPDLALMAGRNQVMGLTWTDLAFRAEEFQAFVLRNYDRTVSKPDAEELVRVSEGWITGLLLSIQTMQVGLAERFRLAHVLGVSIYDYLAQQVFEQQPPAVQHFLLRSSILEEFDAELVEAVLGPAAYVSGESWSDLLNILVQNNLFVTRVDHSEIWLRYHQLFQDFLQSRLEAEHPAERVQILRRLAVVQAERKAWDKAYHLLQLLDEVEAMADLIEQAGLDLVRRGRLTTLSKWIDELPVSLTTSRSELMALRGIAAVMLGQVDHGLSLLNQAEAMSQAVNSDRSLARTLVWRAVAHRFKGDYQLSLADADAVIGLTRQDSAWSIEYAEALRAKGMALYRLGYLAEAATWLEQALAACNDLDDRQTATILLFELGITYSDTGCFTQALECCSRALDHWQRTNNITWQANLLNSQGIIYQLQGDYEQAILALEAAIGNARQSQYARLEAASLITIGDIYTELAAQDAGEAAYTKAREVAVRIQDNLLLFYLSLVEASLSRNNMEYVQARHLLAVAHQLALESNSCHELGLYQLEMGRLCLAEDKPLEALTILEEALHSFSTGGQRIEAIKVHLFLAVCHDKLSHEPTALAHLSFVFNLASELESQHPLAAVGRDAVSMLERVQDNPMVGFQSTRLLRQITQFEQDIPAIRRRLRKLVSTVPFDSPRLSIKTLGKTQVLLDGKPITVPEWQTQKRVRELFFYLLAHPAGLTRDVIGAELWPSSSSQQLKLQFKNTVYRLRRALDKDAIVFDPTQGRYLFNRGLDYEYDVETFLKELDRAKATTNSEEQAEAYEAAINQYGGPYLADMSGLWIWPERERLSQAHEIANHQLVEIHIRKRSYHSALRYCQAMLIEEPTSEEAHRQAMRIHAAMGNQVAVIRQFERCRQALHEELDVPVSAETRQFYQTLIEG